MRRGELSRELHLRSFSSGCVHEDLADWEAVGARISSSPLLVPCDPIHEGVYLRKLSSTTYCKLSLSVSFASCPFLN